MSHATDVYGGAFSFLMGHQLRAASDEELTRLDALIDAEDALNRALDHACRTDREPGDSELILTALLAAWKCVKRARHAVG